MPQVADIALVKYLLQHSRTLEVHHKDPSGLTFLECLTKNLAKFPFLAYSACMDELLGRRVPVTLSALVDIWSHISTMSACIRWTIDEEFTPAHAHASTPAMVPSNGSPQSRMSATLASLADLDTLNSRAAPGSSVKAAAVPTSLMTISTGSNIRLSAGASRLAPVSEDEDEESPTYVAVKVAPGVPSMLDQDSVIEEGEEGDSDSDPDALKIAREHTPAACDMADGEGQLTEEAPLNGEAGAVDVEVVNEGCLATKGDALQALQPGEDGVQACDGATVIQHNGDQPSISTPVASKGGLSSFDVMPSPEVRSWQPRQRVPVSSGLSKSLGAAAVSKVLANKSWSMGGSSVAAVEATSMATEEIDLGDEIDVENLLITPSGLKTLRWSLALGEELAHGGFPFMPRQMHIESLQAALRVSSMALVQWRTQANSAEARLLDGGTALHAAVKHEVRN